MAVIQCDQSQIFSIFLHAIQDEKNHGQISIWKKYYNFPAFVLSQIYVNHYRRELFVPSHCDEKPQQIQYEFSKKKHAHKLSK